MGRHEVTPVVLDTHVLVWLLMQDTRLGTAARRLADEALTEESLLVSAMSFWEVAMLVQKGRLDVGGPVGAWRRFVLERGVEEVAVSGDVAVLSVNLEGLPSDPADRIIAATALAWRGTLLTADAWMLKWSGGLNLHDARL